MRWPTRRRHATYANARSPHAFLVSTQTGNQTRWTRKTPVGLGGGGERCAAVRARKAILCLLRWSGCARAERERFGEQRVLSHVVISGAGLPGTSWRPSSPTSPRLRGAPANDDRTRVAQTETTRPAFLSDPGDSAADLWDALDPDGEQVLEIGPRLRDARSCGGLG